MIEEDSEDEDENVAEHRNGDAGGASPGKGAVSKPPHITAPALSVKPAGTSVKKALIEEVSSQASDEVRIAISEVAPGQDAASAANNAGKSGKKVLIEELVAKSSTLCGPKSSFTF